MLEFDVRAFPDFTSIFSSGGLMRPCDNCRTPVGNAKILCEKCKAENLPEPKPIVQLGLGRCSRPNVFRTWLPHFFYSMLIGGLFCGTPVAIVASVILPPYAAVVFGIAVGAAMGFVFSLFGYVQRE